MGEPEKPFACPVKECSMTFTNEDHLNVHVKKHDLNLLLDGPKGACFVADQTPTPTRFFKTCEETGLFQDLQNVNPFDEGFKRAMETRSNSLLSAEVPIDGSLHTPTFPPNTEQTDVTITKNIRKNIVIQHTLGDESRPTLKCSFTSSSSATQSNVQINDEQIKRVQNVMNNNNTEPVTNVMNKTKNKVLKNAKVVIGTPSQIKIETPRKFLKKFTSYKKGESGRKDNVTLKEATAMDTSAHDLEVIIKLPNGEHIKMKPALNDDEHSPKKKLKQRLLKKKNEQINNSFILIPGSSKSIPIAFGMKSNEDDKISGTVDRLDKVYRRQADKIKPTKHFDGCNILKIIGGTCNKDCSNLFTSRCITTDNPITPELYKTTSSNNTESSKCRQNVGLKEKNNKKEILQINNMTKVFSILNSGLVNNIICSSEEFSEPAKSQMHIIKQLKVGIPAHPNQQKLNVPAILHKTVSCVVDLNVSKLIQTPKQTENKDSEVVVKVEPEVDVKSNCNGETFRKSMKRNKTAKTNTFKTAPATLETAKRYRIRKRLLEENLKRQVAALMQDNSDLKKQLETSNEILSKIKEVFLDHMHNCPSIQLRQNVNSASDTMTAL